MTILIVSNGHGEDILASELGKKIVANTTYKVLALPLVGQGLAYDKSGIKKIHAQPLLPSGGFAYLGLKNLQKDISAGLFSQLSKQKLVLKGLKDVKLAICVGDTYNLFFTSKYLKAKKVFIPTAKSNYIKPHSFLDRQIMKKNALVVFPRDEVTAFDLRKHQIKARFLGNLMMDALDPKGIDFKLKDPIGILPGTRHDAIDNLEAILEIVSLTKNCDDYLVALNSESKSENVANKNGWIESKNKPNYAFKLLRKGTKNVFLCKGLFSDIITKSQVVIGLSGTGNEQAAGLGKPVVSFIGPGTQFTPYFARKQKKLLGDAVLFLDEDKSKEDIAKAVDRLYLDPLLCKQMGLEGKARMGQSGAASKMADLILAFLKGEVVF
ncbi:MAG: lipid-A-disaccharide synthase-related protein [Firmicutes bacterium]|nr:lipid-A-disaccharide synthase-related protein [Bacillota bacterium]MDD4262960.1 lipid-A-disaccharide synthase-related protein [Bacillota bacterium]MDD4693167.1 lipid-A-disaccharide synthase-related protein [Bacillota bacterium]